MKDLLQKGIHCPQHSVFTKENIHTRPCIKIYVLISAITEKAGRRMTQKGTLKGQILSGVTS
jgi:hypothetical protein